MPNKNINTAESGVDRTRWNIFYLLSALSTLAITLTVSIQPLFLDKVIVIPYENEGTINAHIQVVTQILALVVVGYFGSYWNRSRRSSVIFYGFLIAAIGALLAPFSKNVEIILGIKALAFYYLMRILVSIGTDTVQMQLSSLGGEAAIRQKEPRLLINMTFMMALGGTLLVAFLMQITGSSYSIVYLMLIPCGVGMAGAWLTKRFLTGKPTVENERELPFAKAWQLIVKDPRMQLCLASAFYVRADMIVLSLFLSLWCISFADVVSVSRAYAAAHAGALLGFLGFVILIAMPFWKNYMAKNSRISAIGASLSLAGVGLVFIGTLTNPFHWTILLPLTLIGIGQAGCLVAPKILAVELSPKEVLGPVLSILLLVSGVGVVMLVQSGGYFFDAVGPQSPFVLIGTGNLLVMLYALWLVKTGTDENKNHVLQTARKVDLKPLIFLSAILPITWLAGRILIGGYVPGSSIGQMPVGFINRYLGDWAFNFLIISLALRPVYKNTKFKSMARYSRMIGLYAFFYAFLHVLSYVWLEWSFQWPGIVHDIYKREFILFGFIAFVLLSLLAITSSNRIISKLGWQRWKQIHKLVYWINSLVALHFILAATHDNGEPYVYAFIVAGLLFYRFKQNKPGGENKEILRQN